MAWIKEYLGILSRIINAAVDVELFDRNPMQRRSGAKRVAVLRNLKTGHADGSQPQAAAG